MAKRNDVILNLAAIDDNNATIDRHRSTVKRTGHGSINSRYTIAKAYGRATDKHEYFEPCQAPDTASHQFNHKSGIHIVDTDELDADDAIDDYYRMEFNETRGIRDMKKYHTVDRHQAGADRLPAISPRTAVPSTIADNRVRSGRSASGAATAQRPPPPPPPPPLPPKRMRNLAQKNRRCHSASPKPMEHQQHQQQHHATKSNATINPIKNCSVVPDQRNRLDHLSPDSAERSPRTANAAAQLAGFSHDTSYNESAAGTLDRRRASPANFVPRSPTAGEAATRSTHGSAVRAQRPECEMDARIEGAGHANAPHKNGINRKQSYFFARGNTWQLDKISVGDVPADCRTAFGMSTQPSDDTEPDEPMDAVKRQQLQQLQQLHQQRHQHATIAANQAHPKHDSAKSSATARKAPSIMSNCNAINQHSIDSDEFAVYTHRKKYAIEMI